MKTILSMKLAVAAAALALAAPALASDGTRDRRDAARPAPQAGAGQPERDAAVAPCGCSPGGMHGAGRTHEVRAGEPSGPSSAPTDRMRSGRR